MQATKTQKMAGANVQTSKVWKFLIFPDSARFSEASSRGPNWKPKERKKETGMFATRQPILWFNKPWPLYMLTFCALQFVNRIGFSLPRNCTCYVCLWEQTQFRAKKDHNVCTCLNVLKSTLKAISRFWCPQGITETKGLDQSYLIHHNALRTWKKDLLKFGNLVHVLWREQLRFSETC